MPGPGLRKVTGGENNLIPTPGLALTALLAPHADRAASVDGQEPPLGPQRARHADLGTKGPTGPGPRPRRGEEREVAGHRGQPRGGAGVHLPGAVLVAGRRGEQWGERRAGGGCRGGGGGGAAGAGLGAGPARPRALRRPTRAVAPGAGAGGA